ncbi:MAG: LysM domain-containing protein [Clostridia bacterium]
MSIELVSRRFDTIILKAQRGDTWAKVAEAFNVSENILKNENRTTKELESGQYFVVPQIYSKVHIIQPTETLESICSKFGISEREFKQVNSGSSFLYVGKKVYLPDKD